MQTLNRKRKGRKIPSGKKQGAQKGHKGNTRELLPPDAYYWAVSTEMLEDRMGGRLPSKKSRKEFSILL